MKFPPLLVLALLFAISPRVDAVAASHRLDGLPHYGRHADDPEVAEDEFIAQAAPYIFSLVRYDLRETEGPGDELPSREVRLLLFAFSLPGELVYNGPATLEVLDRDTVIHRQTYDASDADSLYEIALSLPDGGHYSLRATLHAPGTRVVSCDIPFQLAGQKNRLTPLIGTTLFAILALIVICIRKATHRKAQV